MSPPSTGTERRLGRNVDYRGASACRRRHRPTRPRTDSTRGVRPSRWSSDVLTEITDKVVILYRERTASRGRGRRIHRIEEGSITARTRLCGRYGPVTQSRRSVSGRRCRWVSDRRPVSSVAVTERVAAAVAPLSGEIPRWPVPDPFGRCHGYSSDGRLCSVSLSRPRTVRSYNYLSMMALVKRWSPVSTVAYCLRLDGNRPSTHSVSTREGLSRRHSLPDASSAGRDVGGSPCRTPSGSQIEKIFLTCICHVSRLLRATDHSSAGRVPSGRRNGGTGTVLVTVDRR